MRHLNIKPLSVNEAYRGRRFRTYQYEEYEEELFSLLPTLEVPDDKLLLHMVAAFSNEACDIDNPVKPFLDVLQKAYDFNDKRVFRLIVDKVIVPKGKEYIDFDLASLPIS